MPGFTIAGVIIAVLGTILMMPELFWGYAGIFIDVDKQAKDETWIKHQRFFSEENEKAKSIEEEYRKKIRRWKRMRIIGFSFLIFGLGIKMVGLSY
jgi:hypothetical protein